MAERGEAEPGSISLGSLCDEKESFELAYCASEFVVGGVPQPRQSALLCAVQPEVVPGVRLNALRKARVSLFLVATTRTDRRRNSAISIKPLRRTGPPSGVTLLLALRWRAGPKGRPAVWRGDYVVPADRCALRRQPSRSGHMIVAGLPSLAGVPSVRGGLPADRRR